MLSLSYYNNDFAAEVFHGADFMSMGSLSHGLVGRSAFQMHIRIKNHAPVSGNVAGRLR
jgi:hypothetical protein